MMDQIKGDVAKVVERAIRSSSAWKRPVCRVCGTTGEPRPSTPESPLPTICRACARAVEFAEDLPDRIKAAGIPKRLAGADQGDIQEQVWDALLPWIEGDVPFALLHGPTGTGKSYTAAAALRATLRHRPGAIWTSVPMMALRLRRVGDAADEFMDQLLGTPCLVLDDLGAERSTDYALEMLSCLVLTRWDRDAQTLVTTNARPEQLHEIHPRMASRLASGVVLGIEGKDRRL